MLPSVPGRRILHRSNAGEEMSFEKPAGSKGLCWEGNTTESILRGTIWRREPWGKQEVGGKVA